VDYNVDRMIQWMERAVTGYPGIDLVVFPECCFQGMHPTKYLTLGLKWDSEPILRICAACKRLGIWGVFNPWIKPDDGRFLENVGILVNDEGEIVLKYTKMHPWTPFEPTYPGSGVPVADGPKGSKIAIVICADGRYQEVWREARLNGANLIVHISNCPAPYENAQRASNTSGARFSAVHVLACSSVGMDESFIYCGNSVVVDASGTVLKEAPVGIEWMLESVINPAAMVAAAEAGNTSNTLWEFTHRGASCPDMNGVGLDASYYTAYLAALR